MAQQKHISFAKQFAELEAITRWFEGDAIDLEEGIEKFERGMLLAKELQKRLRDAEIKIQKLGGSTAGDGE